MRRLASICLICALLSLPSLSDIKRATWESMSEGEQSEANLSEMAFFASMTEEEFELMSAVVEAESDRGEGQEGRTMIALTILNRVRSSQFPNSITGVITQSGQFQVYFEGTYKRIGRTSKSDKAVIEASFLMEEEHPNVIFFNSIGFNHLGTPYAYIDGNYFETL